MTYKRCRYHLLFMFGGFWPNAPLTYANLIPRFLFKSVHDSSDLRWQGKKKKKKKKYMTTTEVKKDSNMVAVITQTFLKVIAYLG